MQGRSGFATLLILIAALLPVAALAQGAGKSEDPLLYQGPDREKRLVEKAKQEGALTLYTSLAPTESQPLTQAFEKKYGIKVELWRALSDRVVQRVVNEARAKRHTADVVETNGPEMEILAREKMFVPVHTPYLADLPPASVPSHRLWLPDRMNFFVVAYNTTKVRKEELPATYLGFADPKWKGRIGIEATDGEWMATLIKKLGQEPGMAFFRKLAEQNPEVRKGHVLLAQLVAAGDVQVGLTIYSGNAESLKRKGAPIDWVPIQPVAARAQGIAVVRNAPHPAAALLFVDFVLSPEGQKLYESLGRAPVSTKVKSYLNDFDYTVMNPAVVIDEAEKWDKMWDELFLKK
jgi:iron(III) transport system substrate-binding protein